MASYEAIINLVVQGERALDRIQKKIDNLYKTASDLETKKKFRGSEAAVAFVREQANELERVVSASKQQVREQEKSIIRQSRLNSAVDLYERRQRQLSRTSVVGQKQFAAQIKDLEEGFKFFKDRKSATGVQAIATELGRIIEYDNEINRISERRTANQRKLFAFSKEIAKYESFGLRSGRARETLTKFESVAGTNQLKKAQQYESALRNQLRLLKDQLTEQKRVASIAPRSPIRGGTAFPGSPLALAAQRKSEEQALRAAQRGFPASPILGTATMAGSPRWVAAQEKARSAAERALRAQERAAKAAESAASKEAERIFRESRKGYPSSPIMGSASMAGSPKWIAAQEKNRAAAERRAAAQRRAEERAAKIQSQVAAAAERAADKALREAQKGYPSSPILGAASIEGSPKWKASQESARQKLEKAAIAIDRAAEKALREAQKGYPSSPILGTATMVGSPRWIRAQERLRGRASGAAGGTGLEAAIGRLQEARGARQAFLGDVSPAEAIDKIVREFNQGKPAQNITETFASGLKKGAARVASSAKSFATAATEAIKDVFGIASPSRFMIEVVQNLVSTYIAEMQKSYPRIQAATARAFGEEELVRPVRSLRATSRGFEFVNRPSRGFRPFREAQGFGRETAGATREFNNMMLDFRKQIAELTTQPEIYSNLLRGLPNARITTDLVGAANRRALATELPSFLPTQRMMGPGELEREIAKAFADYVRTIRTPDPWVGLVGDYREFIDKVVAQTQRLSVAQAALPGVRIAGALPAAEQRITSAQQQRIQRAYERSAQRQLAVLSGDAFAGTGRPSLSAANFGFMADPGRIGRLSGIGRALPPAVDVAASAADAGGRDLQETVRQFFDRIAAGVRSAVGGVGGGGGGFGGGRFFGGAGGAGGRGGSAAQVAQLLGLDSLADISRVSTRELEALSGVVSEFRAVLDPTIEGFDRLDDQLRETIAGIGRQLERRAPDAGFLTRQFGPRTARGLSEGLIGGAFPLLFGQGLGAAVGGAAGGFGGGFAGGGLGFGLSLVGTALGTAFDTAVQSAQELGAALNEAAETFDKVKERSLFASKEAEKLASKAEEFGMVATANVLAQQAVIEKIGTSGAKSLQNLATSSDELNRAWAEFNLQLQAALAGPMAGLLEWVTEIVRRINSESRTLANVKDTIKGLPADKQEEFARRNAQIGSQRGGFTIQGLRDFGINIGISPEEANKQRQDLIEEFARFVVPVKVKPTIEQIEQEQLNLLTKQLEVIDIARPFIDAARNANREQQDLDKQRADLVRSYEESIGDIRKRVEDEVRNKRLAVLETENQILDQQGQNRINQLRLINQQLVASAGKGQRPEVEDAAKRAAQIVAQFTEQQLSAEEEAAQIKRNAALDALKFDIQAAEFKANIEKEVSRLSIETARRVADINEQVRRRNEDFDARRFELEKQVAQIKLAAIGRQVSALNLEAAAYNDPKIQAQTANLVENIIELGKYIAASKAPAPLRGIPEGSIGGQGVSTGQFDAIVRKEKDAANRLVNEILAGLDLTKATDIANFKNQVADLAKSFDAPIVAFAQNFNDELQASSRYIELLNQGLKGTTAQQVIQLEQQRAITIAQYNQAIASLENRKNAEGTTEAARKAIDLEIKNLQGARDALIGTVSDVVKGVVLNESIIAARDAMRAMKEEMNELLDKVNQAKFASETFGNAFAGAVTGSISAITGLDVMQERMALEDEVSRLKGLRDSAKKDLARQQEIGRDPSIDNSEAIRQASENYSEYKKRIEEARSEMDKLGDTGRRVQQVLADMLKGIGDAFLEMAQKIIAQQVAMIIFGTILKALGIGASAGSSMSQSGITEGTLAPMRQYPILEGPGFTPSAKGSYFANGTAAFAKGGMFANSVVSSPTLFQFADGGVTRTGLMGEAGPEAIMPLERGADGKLGVKAKLDGAMTRYRRPPGAEGAAEAGGAEPAAGGGVAAAAPIDVRYTVERINSVDYVTADQFRAGMQQAAQQGAAQGEQRTLRRLQQSPSTRRRIGV